MAILQGKVPPGFDFWIRINKLGFDFVGFFFLFIEQNLAFLNNNILKTGHIKTPSGPVAHIWTGFYCPEWFYRKPVVPLAFLRRYEKYALLSFGIAVING